MKKIKTLWVVLSLVLISFTASAQDFSTNTGQRYEVHCSFDDGSSWMGSTSTQSLVGVMQWHCFNSGGNAAVIIHPQKL